MYTCMYMYMYMHIHVLICGKISAYACIDMRKDKCKIDC